MQLYPRLDCDRIVWSFRQLLMGTEIQVDIPLNILYLTFFRYVCFSRSCSQLSMALGVDITLNWETTM